ncbi:MAG: inorganic phosphate transporter [Chlamydiales bacterium]
MTLLFIIALLCSVYVAWSIGANDVANAVGTSVGSGALTLKQAVVIAAIFEFCGAFFLGGRVSETVESGIVNPDLFSIDKADYIYGMLASLLAAGIWLQIASFFGWPVSTTHSIIGAVLGFGLVFGGVHAIYWRALLSIFFSWILSPLLGGALAYLIFSIVRRKILYQSQPVLAAKRLAPYFTFVIFAVLTLIILFKGLSGINLSINPLLVLVIALFVGVFFALITAFLVKKIQEPTTPFYSHNLQVEVGLKKAQKHLERTKVASMGELESKIHHVLDEVKEIAKEVGVREERYTGYQQVEKIFIYFQIIIACAMAFAHGSNDVANAIGPFSAIFNTLRNEPIGGQSIPIWLLILGGGGLVVGLATWGWRVIETVGKKITELTPSRGFSAGFGAAVTIVLASKLGLPISTTHVLVGAVLGVGLARGIEVINLNVIRDIVVAWFVTVPAGAILSALFFFILRAIFS